MDGIKSEIQKYRAIVEGVQPQAAEPRSEMSLIRQLHEGAARPAARTPKAKPAAPRFVLPEAARKTIEKHVDLARIMIENTDKLLESRNITQDAVRLVARRIAEGADLTAYVRPRSKAAAILEGLTDLLAAANPDFASSEVTVSAANDDADGGGDWLVTATDEMVSRCRSGDACTSVINELARQYADREDGSHEAFEMARDALEKRAWEMGLEDGDACDAADAAKGDCGDAAPAGTQRVNFEIFTPLEVTAESRISGKRPVMEKGYNDPATDATQPSRDERMPGGRMGDNNNIPDEANQQQASSAPAGTPAPAAKPQASATPAPAAKPAAKPQPAQKSQTRIEFEKAFKAARQAGQTSFKFQGKDYNTRLKTEDDAKWKAAMAANAQKAQGSAQASNGDQAAKPGQDTQAAGPSEQDTAYAGKMKTFLDQNQEHAKAVIDMMIQSLKGGQSGAAPASGGVVPPTPGQTMTVVKPAAAPAAAPAAK